MFADKSTQVLTFLLSAASQHRAHQAEIHSAPSSVSCPVCEALSCRCEATSLAGPSCSGPDLCQAALSPHRGGSREQSRLKGLGKGWQPATGQVHIYRFPDPSTVRKVLFCPRSALMITGLSFKAGYKPSCNSANCSLGSWVSRPSPPEWAHRAAGLS